MRMWGAILLTALAVPAWAGNLTAVTRQIAIKEILVRVGIPKLCPVSGDLIPFAGAQLELEEDTALQTLKPADWNVKEWQKLERGDCLEDCTCSALSRAYEKRPGFLRGVIAIGPVEKKLSTMVDADYLKCFKKIPGFCDLPPVKSFLATLKKNPVPTQ